MNSFISRFLNQAQNVWNSLGNGPRVTLISFAGVAVLMAVAFGYWSSQADFVVLYGGLTPEDAAAISARLGDDKVPFRYEASRGAILVPATRADTAKLAIANAGLPRTATEGFEIFDKGTFGMTEFQQRINFLRALQGTLARNIQALDAVDTARVSITIPEDNLFVRDKQEAKASVVVKKRAGRDLTNENIAAIKHLVASSVAKLDARNVTILDANGGLLSKPQDANNAGSLSDEQLGAQQRTENHFTEKVQSLLDQFLGKGQSAVRVTAQLNFERVERSTETMDPEKKALLETNTRTEDSKGTSGAPAGVPGVAANTTNGTTATTGESTSTTKKQTSVNNRFHYDTVTERVVAQVGAVKRLSIAVLVAPKPGKAAEKPADGAAAAAPAAAPAPTPWTEPELAKLKDIVRSAVGFSPERQDTIEVKELAFSEAAASALAPPALAPTSPMDLVQRYLSDVLTFLAVAVMALVFWRSFSKMSTTIATGGAALQATTTTTSTANVQQDQATTVTMRDEVKQLVTQNNAQAVNIIRSMLR